MPNHRVGSAASGQIQISAIKALGEAVERPQWLPAWSLAPGRRRPEK